MKKLWSRLSVLLVLCLSMLSVGAAHAEDSVAVNEQNFPDPVFRSYVLTLPGAEDGVFTAKELRSIKRIMCDNEYGEELGQPRIKDLKGIEFFTDLRELDCSFNDLTELDLRNNTELEILMCRQNELEELCVSESMELKVLYCGWNHLCGLDLSRNPNLEELYCEGNKLTELDLSQNRMLKNLWCHENRLSSLDLSVQNDLRVLLCGDNYLTSLDLNPLPLLEELDCGGNQAVVKDGALIWESMPGFDVSRASSIRGGRFENGRVVYDSGSLSIYYNYDCGKGDLIPFQLDCRRFYDVKEDDWFHDAVRYTVDREIFSGISKREFGPTLKMTRAMAVQTLYAVAGKPDVEETGRFVDVQDSDWFSDAVAWAVQSGVSSGYPGGRFAPNDYVNREQFAVMLHGYMGKPGASQPLNFADNGDISGWARNALQWAVENEMMSGVPGNKILPQGATERSQAAVIMMNFDRVA